MTYDNISRAVFMKRLNRFVALVHIGDQIEAVHVKNTGRCKELLIPGAEVWVTASSNSSRKTKDDLVTVRKGNGVLYNIDSQAANLVAAEWLERLDFDKVIPEYRYGDSRIDCYMAKVARRKSKNHLKGPAKRTEEDDRRFKDSFRRLIESSLSDRR